MRLSFHGAAGGVTGSCHLVEAAGRRILVDCGMFQGGHALDLENAAPFGFDAAAIDTVLLTHAHLDHCGRLPLLYKRGFRGRVLTTAATAELAKLVLLDSAAMHREELHRRPAGAVQATSGGAVAAPAPAPGNGHAAPLYDANDVAALMERLDAPMAYGQTRDLAPGIRATFGNAGHILGSAWILLELQEGTQRRRVVFSGDLGNREKPIINPPAAPPHCDLLVMESTYGDRNHKSMAATVTEFEHAITTTLQRGGNVVIPTFALERAQDLLYFLRPMIDSGAIGRDTPVYLDSPMAISATETFRRHAELFNPAMQAVLRAGHDPFAMPALHFTRDTQASRAINAIRGGAIIMAGSGMAAGGRVLHHLRHNLARREASVIFVGYAARGTLARAIVDGARQVHMFGDTIPVNAQIFTIGGFSAHADKDELTRWAAASQAERIILVHGEPEAAQALAAELRVGPRHVDYPALNAALEL